MKTVQHQSNLSLSSLIRNTALAAAGLALLILLFSPLAGAAPITVGGGSDCDANAIIRCGAHSTPELRRNYGSSEYVQKVYRAFGISAGEMENLRETNYVGRVTKNGTVYVEGKGIVATGAITAGRQNIAGSTQDSQGGAVFFKRPPSVSFQQNSLPAFVSMKNDKFKFAIIASCGNPVMAAATVTPAAQPKPQPQPTPTTPVVAINNTNTQAQAQAQSQNVVVNQSQVTNVPAPAPAPAPVATPVATPAPVVVETVAAQPVALPNTGPAGLIGLFAAATASGFLLYRRYLNRRLDVS